MSRIQIISGEENRILFAYPGISEIQTQNKDRPSSWSRAGSTLNKWLWGALCCGLPGIPCFFCSCCEKDDDRDRPRINRATATTERISRPHRPHAPRGRKSTPEMLSAVRCALSELQGDTAPLSTSKKSSRSTGLSSTYG